MDRGKQTGEGQGDAGEMMRYKRNVKHKDKGNITLIGKQWEEGRRKQREAAGGL